MLDKNRNEKYSYGLFTKPSEQRMSGTPNSATVLSMVTERDTVYNNTFCFQFFLYPFAIIMFIVRKNIARALNLFHPSMHAYEVPSTFVNPNSYLHYENKQYLIISTHVLIPDN
jgi:hypothetical protein